MTQEQLIVIGFLAAAFVAGWLARALIARRDRVLPVEPAEDPALDERLQRAIDATRADLDRALRSHIAAIAGSLRLHDAGEPVSGELAEEVSAALQDDVANECMLSVMDGEDGAR